MTTQFSKSCTQLVIRKSLLQRNNNISLLLVSNHNNNKSHKICTQSLVTEPPRSTSNHNVLKQVENSMLRLQRASISTSNKKPDGSSVAAEVTPSATTDETATTTTKKKTWRSYGFDFESEERDRNIANGVFFFTVTVALIGISFSLAYFPDIKFKDWSLREGYIELARREALGLPLVDPDLVPVEKFELPSDEELGDFDIII